MQQLRLIQSGCQQWIRQPAAVQQAQFAFSSSLAVYIHSADDYRLLKILAQHDQHLNALCWSPVDARLLACATSQQVVKVYELDSEAVIYRTQAPGAESIRKLCWSTHDENVIMGFAGNTIGSWAYKQGEWQTLHTFKSAVTCTQQSASETRLLAVGCADCSLHLYDILFNKVVCTVKLDDGVVPCDLQFDPLSKQYLLVLCRNGSSSIYGVGDNLQTLTELHTMAKQPAAERAAAFIPNQPGNFVSISTKTGVLQLWNVSQQQPLRSMKAGKVPAQSVQFLPGTSRALLTYQDGTVMVYDISTQETLWSSQPGHTETIFDCCFAPHNPQLLATCSYDGTIRIWDAAAGACVKTLELQAGSPNSYRDHNQASSTVLYSVTWSPDGSQLAASSASGIVYLFDYAKGVLVKQWQIHAKMCLKVAWHPTEPKLLVSSGQDGLVAAFSTDGTRAKDIRHSTGMLSCAWHPKQKWVLATTSDTGPVYTWNLNAAGSTGLLQTLNGHTKKSFGVAWSPLLDNMLLTGSDDATARVWDVRAGTCCALLVGHRTEVRALCWHPEVPWMVFTGSWDATIRAWDIRSQQCIHTCYSHHGDVYGLHIHPACPWIMASASRDTTIRLWDLKGLAAGVMVRCFLEGCVPRGQAEQYAAHTLPMMCGPASEELVSSCSSTSDLKTNSSLSAPAATLASAASRIEFYQKVSDFFTGAGAARTLWQLAAAVAAHLSAAQNSTTGSASTTGIRPLPAAESCGFQHMAVAKQAMISAANQLELSTTKGRVGGMKVAKGAQRKEALHEAAMKHLQAGNVERCCDLLVEEENWHTALMLAPAVSQQYWCKLLRQRADAAAKAGASLDELLPLLLVTGQTTALVEMLKSKGQFTIAANVAAVEAYGGYQHLTTSKQSTAQSPYISTSLNSPTRLSATTSIQPLSPTRTLPSSLAGQQLLSFVGNSTPSGGLTPPSAMQPTTAGSAAATSPLLQRRARDSLPPLRTSSSNLSPAAVAVAAAAVDATDTATGEVASNTARVGSVEATGLGCSAEQSLRSPALEAASCRPKAGRESIAGADSSPAAGAGFIRMRTASGSFGGCAVMDQEAVAQLASVRQAQALAYRRQGQPLLAACAHLTVNNIEAAVTALHLGNEPEQAAMLALALGRLGGVDQLLLNRVYEALASKCEAASDWVAAAAATRLQSSNVDHQLELLVVRQERSMRQRNMLTSSHVADAAERHPDTGSLRQQMGLKAPLQYAAMADSADESIASVRFLLLADDHPRAAAKAALHLQGCVSELQQQVVLTVVSISSTSKPLVANTQALQQQQSVQQLLVWQQCLESLDAALLAQSCWHELFSYILLAGALQAFIYGYTKVGSYLMSTLRHWIEQHRVKGFPMCHSALLVLEAEALASTNPDAAWSLLIAAADGAQTPDDIRSAARQKLQSYPRAAPAADAVEAAYVIAAGSNLPSRAAVHGSGRSAVSGSLLSSGAVMLLDDESSIVSLSEAVMLSHVMKIAPHGTGMTPKLLT